MIKTVGELRTLLDQLPATAIILPDWASDPPGDHEPGVVIKDFAISTDPRGRDNAAPYLSVKIALRYLDEDLDDGDDDDEEDDDEDDEDD